LPTSAAQRGILPHARWIATVHNGIALESFHCRPAPGDYLVFLGRISPEQRPDRAIDLARDVGMRLLMAAKVDPVDQAYHEYAIKPLIASSPLIEFVGEVNEREKDGLLGGAYAYLVPGDGPAPFGLTMAEAMATGTPVVAIRTGAAPEVVVDGVTGFVCANLRELIDAIPRVAGLDRRAGRAHAERHFSPAAMADGSERAYAPLRGERARVAPRVRSHTEVVIPAADVVRGEVRVIPEPGLAEPAPR